MKVGNPQVFKLCWKLKWGEKKQDTYTFDVAQFFFFQPLLPVEHVRAKNLDLHPRSGCASYGEGEDKCMTMQFANL